MKIFSLCSFIIPISIVVALVQSSVVGAEIHWERNKETSNPPTLTELPTSPKPKPAIQASICPANSTISPCFCFINESKVAIDCADGKVNQATIENLFQAVRVVNEIPEDGGIHMYQFVLKGTKLPELDLAPFYNSQFDYLASSSDYTLSKLVTSGHPGDEGSIQVTNLYLSLPNLNRQGFGDALKYFSNQMTSFYIQRLSLNDSVEEDRSESEFLPGLSALKNLGNVKLEFCNIKQLNSDQWDFRGFENLNTIDFYGNQITSIGEYVFDFSNDENNLYINLLSNQLNETSFHPNSGIARAGRKTNVDVRLNKIKSLPAEVFEFFLDTHPGNQLNLEGNPLICDERLSWIKSRRGEFQNRVFGARCNNDPGHSVFDSELIP